jgi:acyl carrier protein
MDSARADEVMAKISEVLAPIEAKPEDNFDDLETTSVHMLRLMVTLQREFDVDIDVVDMFEVEFVEDLIRLVVGRLPQQGAVAN